MKTGASWLGLSILKGQGTIGIISPTQACDPDRNRLSIMDHMDQNLRPTQPLCFGHFVVSPITNPILKEPHDLSHYALVIKPGRFVGTRPVAVWWELGPKRNHRPKASWNGLGRDGGVNVAYICIHGHRHTGTPPFWRNMAMTWCD